MIVLKTTRELTLMREACRISAQALKVAGEAVRPGITTWEIDKIAYDFIKSQGAEPNFLNLYGFPATACISINDEVIHGIPSKKRVLKSGDIVSIDLGAKVNGYNGDNAATFACGDISDEAKRLMDTTRESLYEALRFAVPQYSCLDPMHRGAWWAAVWFSSVAQSYLTLCEPMDCSTPGFPVHHQLLEFTQIHFP